MPAPLLLLLPALAPNKQPALALPLRAAQVLEVVAGHRGIQDRPALAEQLYGNAERMFFSRQQQAPAPPAPEAV